MGCKLMDEKGLTLVELLATISIASLLILMITSAHLLIQNQFRQQVDHIEEVNDLTYLLKVMTTDFRRAHPNEINMVSDHSIKLGEVEYKWDEAGKRIQKNGRTIIQDIDHFFIEEEREEIYHFTIRHKNEDFKQLTLTKREGE